ncbi:MAG: hypothetical protein U0893_12040 [Chloroflexota bacterium]
MRLEHPRRICRPPPQPPFAISLGGHQQAASITSAPTTLAISACERRCTSCATALATSGAVSRTNSGIIAVLQRLQLVGVDGGEGPVDLLTTSPITSTPTRMSTATPNSTASGRPRVTTSAAR